MSDILKSVELLAVAESEPARLRAERTRELLHAADSRILVMDGATGTALQSLDLTAQDFGGPEFEGCNENLVLLRPEIVRHVHKLYLDAGCDIVETNTFGATPLVLAEYGLEARTYEINKLASEIARTICREYDQPNKTHFVAGSIGPTTKSLSITGGVTFDELIVHYFEQVRGLFDGGADYFLIETCNDTRNIKAALFAIDRLFEERGEKIPVAVSATIESTGTMLAGQSVEALTAALMNRDLFYLGLNCATGPEFMTDHIRSLSQLSPFRVACVPNAGLPNEDGCYLETPAMLTRSLGHFVEKGWINIVGGCCGTHAGHVKSLAHAVKGLKPRLPDHTSRSLLSGVDPLEVTPDLSPVIVGERTNVIGSRKFKDLIKAGLFEDAAEIARAQVKAGAQIIDICLADPESDEVADIEKFLERVVRKIRVPIMLDSTDAKVFEVGLKYCQGKAVLNSINLEDGEERFEAVVPLAMKYGAAVVVGTIDEDPEQGMGVTRDRKLEIAARSYGLLTDKYGMKPEDIYFDPLVFPCGTGDQQYRTSAPETIEGIRLIKAQFPKCKTILGISNVSFGLPAAGREVLNSVFLYHCVQAGLDLAIVNSEKLERFGSLPPEDIKLAEHLLFTGSDEALAAFTLRYRDQKGRAKKDRSLEPLAQRLSGAVVEGSKEGLIEDLTEALRASKPLDIINGPLMAGMDEVGRLFNANKLIVAEVLQSAEVMKAAVSFLEPHMEKSEVVTRGKVCLATVKGDVHDIGKNLVEIILSNNGYEVINLGIKVAPEQLIRAVKDHKPDIIGLSGLLVKSAHQMVTTVEDLKRAGIQTPILVGGAALSRGFVDKRILPAYGGGAVIYAQDAMGGLDLASQVMNPESFRLICGDLDVKRQAALDLADAKASGNGARTAQVIDLIPRVREKTVRVLTENPPAPDFDLHVMNETPLNEIWKYINPLMLYTRHLGVKASSSKLFAAMAKDPLIARRLREEDPTALDIYEKIEEVKRDYNGATNGAGGVGLRPKAKFRFYRAQSSGEMIQLFEGADAKTPLASFEFLRQNKGEQLCLSDYLSPLGGPADSMAMFVVTAGTGVREIAADLKARGEFLKSHIIQALAIETAEAYAEWLHAHLRRMWGHPDGPDTTMMDRFQAKYRGKRYSFGYPACPRLEDQSLLFDLLKPEEIGVSLTEGFMMDPEASVSAVVFHHPDAKYFGVSTDVQGADGGLS